MSRQNYGTINYKVYEKEVNYLGIAEVTLPDFEYATLPVSGAGLPGETEIPVLAQLKPLITNIKFLHTNEAAAKLSTQEVHELALWIADEFLDSEAGQLDVDERKIIMRVIQKKRTSGTLKPSSPQDVSGEYIVYYYAEYLNGKRMTLFDYFNNKYIDHSGVDRTEKINKALGMM